MIFYPDAHPETKSVDGTVFAYEVGGVDWATLVAHAGNGYSDESSTNNVCRIRERSTSANKWREIQRGIILFDTSSIPSNFTIEGAVLSLYGSSKSDGLSISIDVNIYSSNPASDTGLENGDFARLGSIPFCDTPITYNNWVLEGYNNFTLNAAGIAAIDKEAITKLGTRNANHDVADIAPTWLGTVFYSYLACYTADDVASKRPKLVVTYSTVEGLGTQNIVTLEALRNIEMAGQSRLYIDDEGNAKYESRFHRSL